MFFGLETDITDLGGRGPAGGWIAVSKRFGALHNHKNVNTAGVHDPADTCIDEHGAGPAHCGKCVA